MIFNSGSFYLYLFKHPINMRPSYIRRLAVILVFLIAFFLRIYQSAGSLLWEDEAETALNSIGILDTGLPSGFFRGMPLFESPFVQKSDSPVYEFSEYNYANGLPRYHGWLPFYPIALSFKLFGASAFAARLPSVLFSMMSLFLAYQFSMRFYNRRVAMISLTLLAANPFTLYFERQARYHALAALLVLAAIYFFYLAFTANKKRDYLAGTMSLTLLFYTHLLASLITFAAVTLYYITTKGVRFFLRDRKFLLSSILFGALILPWFIYLGTQDYLTPKLISLQPLRLLALSVAASALLIIVLRGRTETGVGKPTLMILVTVLAWIVISPLATPIPSRHIRIFAPLIPIIIIALISYLDTYLLQNQRKKTFVLATLLLLVAASLAVFMSTLVQVDIMPYDRTSTVGTLYHYVLDGMGTDWLKEALALLAQRNATAGTLVLITYDNYPLMFHTEYKAQLVWPIRKGYIDGYGKKMFILEEPAPFLMEHCAYFYKYFEPEARCGANAGYIEKISNCKKYALESGARVYECN